MFFRISTNILRSSTQRTYLKNYRALPIATTTTVSTMHACLPVTGRRKAQTLNLNVQKLILARSISNII